MASKHKNLFLAKCRLTFVEYKRAKYKFCNTLFEKDLIFVLMLVKIQFIKGNFNMFDVHEYEYEV